MFYYSETAWHRARPDFQVSPTSHNTVDLVGVRREFQLRNLFSS